MDGTDETGQEHPGAAHVSLDLDALAVSDRFRLFNFTRRDDHLAYLWVLRALERLRAVHHIQAHTEDVAQALAELAAAHPDVPGFGDLTALRGRLDALAEDGILHRLEDAARAGSLARYRNRQSVYQFSELGYRAYSAVEDVLRARVRDANLSRLVFSDILEDLRALHAAVRDADGDQVYRRLSRLDTVLDDMSRRAAQFHLTLGEIMRSTDTSPGTFLKYKNALLTHMTDFMAELDRYLPRLAAAIAAIDTAGRPAADAAAASDSAGPAAAGAAGVAADEVMLGLVAGADDRPFLSQADKRDDWRRRWAALHAWFAPGESRAEGLRTATRAAVSAVIALLRQVTEAQRGGVNRSSQLRHLAEWVFNTPDEPAAHALMTAAFNLRTARHLGGAHDDADLISSRGTWWDAPGVDISVTLFRRGKAPTPGVPQPARNNPAVKAALARRQAEQRAAERAAARSLLDSGAHHRVLDENETRVLLRLLTLATEARTVVAGRLATASGGNDVLTMRLVPSEQGSTVATRHGTLHLPGFQLELTPASALRRAPAQAPRG
ncbi:MAG TPA: TIGR02677 family protein [Trebonia sp.]|nr:TIGR02677 family protein [Trebonia sp.]